jgi:heat shock protein HslJ
MCRTSQAFALTCADDPEHMPMSFRPALRRLMSVCAIAAAALLLAPIAAIAAGAFPFDQEMMLDAPQMGRVKRMPMLIVEPNGNATIQLWCKDMSGRVEVSDDTIRIQAGPLPDAFPTFMTEGQCSPERMQADADMLAELVQMTSWQHAGDRLVLTGPTTLRFLASNH